MKVPAGDSGGRRLSTLPLRRNAMPAALDAPLSSLRLFNYGKASVQGDLH